MNKMRIGYGYDVHRLVEDRPLILGGVTIPHKLGLLGHSDADVLIHAICDALLGAAAIGDIGKHFPDSDGEFKDIDSRVLLRRCFEMLNKKNYSISNVDATIVAQQPKLSSFIENMRENVAADLELSVEQVSIKATTSETLGLEGEEKGISASAVTLIFRD